MNSIWKIEYDELPSNDKSESGWMDSGELTIAAKTAEVAIEKAKKYSLRPSNFWFECDEDGNETNKRVNVVGFRLTGVTHVSNVDLQIMAAMNNIALARDKFMEDPKNKGLMNDRNISHEYYLRNRIEISFLAGWRSCIEQYGIIEPEKITEPFHENN